MILMLQHNKDKNPHGPIYFVNKKWYIFNNFRMIVNNYGSKNALIGKILIQNGQIT